MPTVRSPLLLPALTSIRGIAAWYVVMFHFRDMIPSFGLNMPQGFWAQGYLSVDLFFELSGFVISLNYLHGLNLRAGSAIEQSLRFLWLRLGRIYPLHITVLCLMIANPLAIHFFSGSNDSGLRYDPLYFVLSVFLVQDWGFLPYLAWNVPAWSISAEWFVYLLFPVMAWLAYRIRLGPFGWAMLVPAMALGLAAISVPLGFTLGAEITQGGVFRCVAEFSMGLAVCRVWVLRREAGQALHGDAAMCAAIGLLLLYILLPVPDIRIMPFCFALVIFGLADTGSIAARLLGGSVLQWIGTVSYATYMIHYLVKDWVKFLVVRHEGPQFGPTLIYIVATALLSALLYYTVEVPGRTWFRSISLARFRSA